MQSRRLPLHSETRGALVAFQQIDLVLTFGAVLEGQVNGMVPWNGIAKHFSNGILCRGYQAIKISKAASPGSGSSGEQ